MDRFDEIVIAGCILVALGAGLIYIPAGLIVAGIEAIAIGVLFSKGQQRIG